MNNIDWNWLGEGLPQLGIGLLIGYAIGRLQDNHKMIKEMWMERRRKHDERGIVKHRVLADVTLLIIIVITVWAAVQSQIAVNKVTENQEAVERQYQIRAKENACISSVLFATVQALNERTSFTVAQAEANVALQRAQAEMLGYFLDLPPDATEEERRAVTTRYFEALTDFINLSVQTQDKAEEFKFPTEEEFIACLDQAHNPAQED